MIRTYLLAMPSASSPIPASTQLSRRERQIMDVVYRRGRATAAEIHDQIPDPPCAAAVRTLLTPGSATLMEMRTNIQRLSYPRASFDIARLVLSYVPPAGAASAWASVPRSRRGRLSRALSHRNSALRRARRVVNNARRNAPTMLPLPQLRRGSGQFRRGLGLPTLGDARALLQRRPTHDVAPSRHPGAGNWR